MMKFLSLGSGSSGNCYILQSENTCLMIDAGVAQKEMLELLDQYGIAVSSIDAVLVTHDHADHIKSLGILSTEYERLIYTTVRVHNGMLRNYCMKRAGMKLNLERRRVVKKGEVTEIGDFRITPFPVPHDSSDCVGYRIECGDKVFCIATDVGEVTPVISQQISDADYLVIEADYDAHMLEEGPYPEFLKRRIRGAKGHLSNYACGHALAQYATPKLKYVWLCHLSDENNHPDLARKTVERILASAGIVAGVDFQLEVLKRKYPCGFFELI